MVDGETTGRMLLTGGKWLGSQVPGVRLRLFFKLLNRRRSAPPFNSRRLTYHVGYQNVGLPQLLHLPA